MRSFRLFTPLLLLPAITACSSSSKDKPDAFVVIADATPDTPPPPPGCNYGELRDDSNDDALTTGSPEDTMVSFNGSAVLCGSFNVARYDATKKKVDADAYQFVMPADGQVYVSMYGAGLDALGGAEVQVYADGGTGNLVGYGVLFGNHAAMTVGLAAGSYEVYVRAANATAPAADVPYKVKLTTDDIDARCAVVTTGGYAEAHDNANNLGNDMIGIDFAAMTAADFEKFTTVADVAEPSLLTITDGMKFRFSGSGEVTNAVVGSYKDRDTFEITTGANTNELTIRTGWTAATADLDLFVFEKAAVTDTVVNELSNSAFTGMGPNEEYVTLAVKPNTPYWVWIGNYKDSTGAGAYSTTICGVNYTPPAN